MMFVWPKFINHLSRGSCQCSQNAQSGRRSWYPFYGQLSAESFHTTNVCLIAFFFAPDARIPAGRSNNETGGAVPGHWRNANWDQSSHGTYLFMCCIWQRMCFASCLTDDMPNTQRKRLVHCIDVLLVDCWANVYGSKSQSYCVAKRRTIKRRPGTALIGSWMCISLLTVI